MSRSDTKISSISRQEFKQFVELRVRPHLQSIALKFCELVAQETPELVPGLRGGTEKYIPVPVWRLDRDVMVLSPSAVALTISFSKGALFDDPEGRLGGAGKASRTLKLRSESDLAGSSIVSFLHQAVQHR